MKIYTNIDVLTASQARMDMIYQTEPNVIVSVSGGKDSTIVLELAIEAARKAGKLPITASFLDQESEYEGTIEYMRYLQNRPEIKLYWWQVPFVLTNSTSSDGDNYLHCWEDGKKWMREKEPDSIKVNPTKETRFHELFPKLWDEIFPGQFYLSLVGIRANESQIRMLLMYKGKPCYKNIRWASEHSKGVKLYPIYDWTTPDVWKAIYDHGWKYNTIYDQMYRRGVKTTFMRVSSLIHETGHWALEGLHEMEPGTYEALANRVQGVATYHSGGNELYIPKHLPLAFANWQEYRDYLLENLILDEGHKKMFIDRWTHYNQFNDEEWARDHVGEVILNDYEGVKNKNSRHSRFTKQFEEVKSE